MEVLEPPMLWLVTLHDGTVAHVWANALTQPTPADDRYTFGVLVDATAEEQVLLDVLATTPSRAGRVEVCVARFAAQSVASVVSGMAG